MESDFRKKENNALPVLKTVKIAHKQSVLAARNMILERFALTKVKKIPKSTKHVLSSAENALVPLNLSVFNAP